MDNGKGGATSIENHSSCASHSPTGKPLPYDQVQLLRQVYHTLDKNKDGLVTIDELSSFLSNLNLHLSPSQLHSLAPTNNEANQGQLTFEEFLYMYKSLQGEGGGGGARHKEGGLIGETTLEEKEEFVVVVDEEEDLREAFRVFDLNGDGLISASELREVLILMGLRGEDTRIEECQTMIRREDIDGNGFLDFHEFKQMLASLS